MERTRPEYPGILKLALEMPMDPDVARCLRVLLDAGRPVKFGPGTDIPLAADVSEKFGIKSFMAVALRPRVGKPWQFGVHQCSRARTWTPEEERLLQEIGRRLADGLSTMLVQRNLQESEAKYRRIVDTALEGIGGIGPDGRITFVNGRLAGILGYSADELPGRPITDFMLEQDLEEYRRFIERRHQGISEQLERRFKHKDGHTVWTIVSSVPVLDEARNYTGTFAMLTDISERKCAEEALRQLNQELEQRVAGRTAALEQANNELESFSYSVSHDLRAPLRAIDGFSRILSEEYNAVLGEQGRRYTGTIASNARRMGQLINDILDFSRMSRREIAATPVDMTALAREVYDEVRAAAPAKRAIVLRMEELPPACADPALLRQVWVNLLSNAVKYTGQRAEAVIEVGGATASGENTYWVKDNGAGFDMRYADKLFGVFQRLHGDAEFEGTGIGLAIVKRIVTRHGGRVWAESKLGESTALYFTLPASQQQCGS
jgi:PAS domain S-box-containing protein